ncbi:biotin--[acetyl-CoA-carboxylase] ligase [Pseudonocardia sp.]|uniref:biotin--[acetyl-CoA-carboxylase] ligase n=1 Tax=Pseudonocardia sp. TaxID=60912 RepID=UPI003D0EB688
MTTPLDGDALRASLPGWARLDIVASTGSTNADLLAAAAAGAPDRTVLVAEHQQSGRGRLARTWESPPGSGLTFSVLFRPDGVGPARFGWLPLLAGLALADAVRGYAGGACGLKWPNDLLLGGRKAAGVLAEVAGPGAVVVGIGLNVTAAPPGQPDATSLAEHAHPAPGRADVLVAILRRLDERERAWCESGGDPDAHRLRTDYRAACRTLGSPVRITLPGGEVLDGIAEDVDGDGRLLLVEHGGRRRAVAAGDVTHVRAAPA